MSASTTSTNMSTSNPGVTGLSSAPVGAASPAALGLPDAELIAQWANALFAALPGRPTVSGTAADAQAAPPTSALPVAPPSAPEGEFASLPVAPYVSPTSGFTPPSDAELRAAPASLASGGGVAPPATAATPPDESVPYFLAPAQPGLPGTAVGLGPSAATRIESGAMPTAPSPPSAVAQPAEPTVRSLPASTNGAAALAEPFAGGNTPTVQPYSFRPELVAAPIAANGPAPAPVPVDAPTPAGSFPSATADAPALAGASSAGASVPSTPFLPAVTSTATPFYFLDDTPSSPINAAPTLAFDPFGFPAFGSELDFGSFPFDTRAQAPQSADVSSVSAQKADAAPVPHAGDSLTAIGLGERV